MWIYLGAFVGAVVGVWAAAVAVAELSNPRQMRSSHLALKRPAIFQMLAKELELVESAANEEIVSMLSL